MQTQIIRAVSSIGFVVTVAVAAALGSGAALAQEQSATVCSPGRLQLSLQWADAHVSVVCSRDQLAQTAPSEVVGLIVRWSDGSLSTVDVADASSHPEQASQPATTSVSSSTSISSSTTCTNGRCTSTHSQVVCVDGACSESP